ncbi:UGT-51 protein [Aphelenchoides avenae]|nr:UGT-51 protein [Aphelenchus avenae]
MLRPIALALLLFSSCTALKILVYQTVLGHSHLGYSGAIVDTLVDRGHIVDKLIMAWNPEVTTNGTTRARRIIRVKSKGDSPWQALSKDTDLFGNVRIRLTDQTYTETKRAFCEALADQQDLMDELRREKYDVGMTSLFDSCAFGVFHLAGIKSVHGYVPIQSIDRLPHLLGIPTPPSFVADIMDQNVMTDRLSFIERVWNFVDAIEKYFESDKFFSAQQQVFDDRYKRFPRLTDLYKRMTYVFLNTDEVLDMPKPSSPKLKYIGGIAVKTPKKLSPQFDRILARSQKGTVVFSFGTFASTDQLPKKIKRKIGRAFAKFKDYNFIWKYDSPEEDSEYFSNFTNVYRIKWLPQTDLLRERHCWAPV